MNHPAIIFIHGFRGNHDGLAPIAEYFDGWDFYLPDIPPFGDSKPLKDYTPDSYADFIKDFTIRHNLERPILVGHSMGSIIASATVEKYPDIFNEKLVLLSPISIRPPQPFASLQPAVTLLPNRLVSYITTRFLSIDQNHNEFKKTLAAATECAKNFTSKKDVKAATKFSANHCIRDFRFNKDTLLLAGDTDRLIAKHHTEKLANDLGAKSVFIKKSGHLINYEKPAEIASIIKEFLDR